MATRKQPQTSLFDPHEQREIDRLEMDRLDVKRRIEALPRLNHKRIALEARLQELTTQQMRLSNRIAGNRS